VETLRLGWSCEWNGKDCGVGWVEQLPPVVVAAATAAAAAAAATAVDGGGCVAHALHVSSLPVPHSPHVAAYGRSC
jgi:hypothetical protein